MHTSETISPGSQEEVVGGERLEKLEHVTFADILPILHYLGILHVPYSSETNNIFQSINIRRDLQRLLQDCTLTGRGAINEIKNEIRKIVTQGRQDYAGLVQHVEILFDLSIPYVWTPSMIMNILLPILEVLAQYERNQDCNPHSPRSPLSELVTYIRNNNRINIETFLERIFDCSTEIVRFIIQILQLIWEQKIALASLVFQQAHKKIREISQVLSQVNPNSTQPIQPVNLNNISVIENQEEFCRNYYQRLIRELQKLLESHFAGYETIINPLRSIFEQNEDSQTEKQNSIVRSINITIAQETRNGLRFMDAMVKRYIQEMLNSGPQSKDSLDNNDYKKLSGILYQLQLQDENGQTTGHTKGEEFFSVGIGKTPNPLKRLADSESGQLTEFSDYKYLSIEIGNLRFVVRAESLLLGETSEGQIIIYLTVASGCPLRNSSFYGEIYRIILFPSSGKYEVVTL
ncbi:MAG: hypothetical protein NZZ41_04440 [Candidatus Dojkabacteria bacterium]|nr:hypothetical protein [Candidatus Dojkabacteria bacterium]